MGAIGDRIRRRDFLGTAAVGALATVAMPTALSASQQTSSEQANLTLVNDFCAAWFAPMDLTRLVPFLAPECVYRATETTPPVTGIDAIVGRLEGVAGSSFCEFEVLESFAKGSIVINERWDRFELPERKFEWHGVGVFYVKDGLIAEWSDFTIT